MVPLAVPELGMSRHLPASRTVPSGFTVHCCAACPSQVHITTGLPFAVLSLLSSTHRPGISDTTGPAGSVHFWLALPLHDEIQSWVPLYPVDDPARHFPAVPLTT